VTRDESQLVTGVRVTATATLSPGNLLSRQPKHSYLQQLKILISFLRGQLINHDTPLTLRLSGRTLFAPKKTYLAQILVCHFEPVTCCGTHATPTIFHYIRKIARGKESRNNEMALFYAVFSLLPPRGSSSSLVEPLLQAILFSLLVSLLALE